MLEYRYFEPKHIKKTLYCCYSLTLNDIFSNAQLASGATLSAWFNTDSTAYGLIADNEGYLTLGVNHIYAANPNKLFGIVDGGHHRYFSSSDVIDNLWHHAAIVWDGTDTAILYLDGVNVSSGPSGPPTPDRKTRPFTIGTHSTLAAYFNGTIDDVRVYNRALSAEEIRANMHTRLAGDEPNLVGYWDFDEGEGQIVYDLSGNGNDGQLGVTADEDVSDPAWVESDAPVGICSLYQIATLAVGRAVECKTALIEKLLAALTEEWKAYEALEEVLESGDYGDLNKGDIITAKQKIHSAIQHQEQTIDALEKSIEKLEDALSALGYELEPPSLNQRLLDLWGLEWTEPVPVMEVNTDFAEEWTPFLSFDGLTLYFTRVRSDTFYYGRIFEATRDEPYGPFTSVKEIDGALNSSPGHVISPWVSPDNLRMYYYTELSAGWELKVTERASDNDPWPIGTNITELNVLGTRHQTPRLTANELTIFFSSRNMPGGYGGYDIWTATRPDRNSPFGTVRNLAEINTVSSDHAPFVSPDGLMLYFDSNRNGEFQLFRAARGSLNEPFGNIEHLSLFDTPEGISIHPCASSDGTAIYFVRVVEGQHNIWVSYRIEDPYELAIIRTEDAIAQKAEVLERISAELEKEWTAYEALEELLESGDYGDLNKGDIITAKQKIHSAIQHQEQTIDALEKSIEKLEDALSALGYEPEPPVPNQPPNVNITNPTEGAVFTPSQTIEIGANAWDVDGSVVKVEFFANGSKTGEDNDGTDGWKTNWYDHPSGTYSLTAKATDNDGAATTSPAVGITVVELPPPGQASNPHPADGATSVGINANLSWTAGPNAVSHDVYFGTTSPGTFRGNQTATTFDPGTMAEGITYYWRIDEVNPSGTTTGTVWSFRTSSGPPPPP